MELYILFDTATKEWSVVIHDGSNFVAKSLFQTTNAAHAFTMATGYITIFSGITINVASDLAWRQLGLRASKELAAMRP